jgi:hypothetical protein
MHNSWITDSGACQIQSQSVTERQRREANAPQAQRPEGRLEDVEKLVRLHQMDIVELVEWVGTLHDAIVALGGTIPDGTDRSSEDHYGEARGMSWLDNTMWP